MDSRVHGYNNYSCILLLARNLLVCGKCASQNLIVTVLAKTGLVRTKTEFNFIATVYRHSQYLYPSPVYQVLNVNWSTFLKDILPTLQSHSWNNSTHGGCQLGNGDLDLLPLFMWPIGVSLTTVWVSWLLMGVPNESFCHLPSHPVPPPIPPTPSIINTDSRKGRQEIPCNSAIRDR